jgi:DNA-binding beta-propeller fold protein YncE
MCIRADRVILFLGCIAALILSGCGASKQAEADKGLRWPAPPDEPRFKYVRTYQGEDDFESKLGALTKAIAGASNGVQLQSPFDVCTDGKGHIWVTDLSLGLVVIDEVKGEMKAIGGQNEIPVKSTRGIAYGDNRLYVGIADGGQVFVLDTEGKILSRIGKQGQFPNPVDIVFDTVKHRVVIVDNKQSQVYVYSSTGDSLFSFGGLGSVDGLFHFPQSVAIDSAGNFYVVDSFNFRVEKFDSTGKYLSKFGSQGDVYGTFSRPKGIAIDTYGNIYVLDAMHNNFQVFNAKEEFLMFVGEFSYKNNGFQDPISICIDRHNLIYVTDHLNGRLQIFQLLKGD